jgi:hypothetical protein
MRKVADTDECQHEQRCSWALRAHCDFENVFSSGAVFRIVVAAIPRAENVQIASTDELRIFSAKNIDNKCVKLHPAGSVQSLEERSSL